MKRPRKYRLAQPPRQTEPPGPPETIVLQPRTSVPAGPPVTPLPGSPAPEVIVLHPRGPKPDPNRPLIPSREEIEQLPRWARVAYAARCAQRVLPLLMHFWPDAPAEHEVALRRAVSLAAQTAAARLCPDSEEVNAPLAREAVYWAGRVADDHTEPATATTEVAQAAADAGHAAYIAVDECWATHEYFYPAYVAWYACSALLRVASAGHARIVLSPRHDLDRLMWSSREQKWTDETAVPQEAFGPMWDRDPPSWWRDVLQESPPPT